MARLWRLALPRTRAAGWRCFAYGALTATNRRSTCRRATPNPPLAGADPDPGPLWVGLAFSGGGTRATAFAEGMLEEIRAMTATAARPEGLLAEVRLVTGVSGGAVNAAWFGLTGPAGLDGFRESFLLADGERYMANSAWNPLTLGRTAFGGANGRRAFGRVLDETLFDGATFADLAKRSNRS